ncbi:MAG: DNA polymerase IV [Armatimonadetes bacterium]|nr:DNA polymerase IV [Armatimonadota bacterium]
MELPVRRILHVDMDAFYASVEQRDHPELRGRPVIVAGSERSRGVVAAASYEARRYGIHSAMPTSQALRLCPEVHRVPVRMARYREVSDQIREIFEAYTDLVEPISLDECFLDVGDTCRDRGVTATAVAREIKALIRQRTGLTSSAGVAPNKFVAKIASDIRKPDGLTVVPPGRVLVFLHPLTVSRIWGVGPKTSERLKQLGVHTIADLAARDPSWLIARFGKSGQLFHRLAHGEDRRPVIPSRDPRSLSSETTFAIDLTRLPDLMPVLQELAEEVEGRLRSRDLCGSTVTLKLRYGDFTTITRSHTLPRAVRDREELLAVVLELLGRTEFPGRPIRLAGIGVSGLQALGRPLQLELFDCVI